VVAAGDNIGATPLVSAAFHDEPTIEALNMIGLDISAVGNHEFDEGVDELLRIQDGGCHPIDGCDTGHDYAGADFQFLAANVVYKDNGKPIFPAYKIRSIAGAKIGFIGLTLKHAASSAPTVSWWKPRRGETINAAPEALKRGRTIVVLIHEGGAQSAASLRARSICAPASPVRSPASCQLDDGSTCHQRPHPQRLQLPASERCRPVGPGQQLVVVRPSRHRHRHDDRPRHAAADVDRGRQQDRLP
jgi:hypothetical protein